MTDKTSACEILFISAILALSFGAAMAADQSIVKENTIVNQTNFQNISKVVFTNISAAGADEYIVVYNNGDDMDLLGWNITVDNTKNYTLPDFILSSFDSVDIHFGKGMTNSTDIYLNMTPNILNDQHGDVKLVDDMGNLISEVKY